MAGKPQDDSIPSLIVRLFEAGGKYTTDELTQEIHKTRQPMRYPILKRQVQQAISHLKSGTRQVDLEPMNIQKLEDVDGKKRWTLIEVDK